MRRGQYQGKRRGALPIGNGGKGRAAEKGAIRRKKKRESSSPRREKGEFRSGEREGSRRRIAIGESCLRDLILSGEGKGDNVLGVFTGIPEEHRGKN